MQDGAIIAYMSRESERPRQMAMDIPGGDAVPLRIKPMLPYEESKVPTGKNWLVEPYPEGWRMMYHRKGEIKSLVTANSGNTNLHSFPRVMDELAALGEKIGEDIVLDGYMVATDQQGVQRPKLLQGAWKRPGNSLHFLVRDLMHLGDESLLGINLADRLALLDKYIAPHFEGVKYTRAIPQQPVSVDLPVVKQLELAHQHGFTGVVLRDPLAHYTQRKSHDEVLIRTLIK